MGYVTACVSHDGSTGDSTSSSIDFSFKDSSISLFIKGQWIDWVEEFSIQFYGGAERWGIANLLKATGEELSKPVDQLGRNFAIDYDSLMYEADYPSISKKGMIGETALNNWFKTIEISYLYINQSQETFSGLFKGNVKRPDFLVLFESIGMIAVDAKNYTLFNGEFSLPFEEELRRTLSFERLFRIPVWYAYLHEENGNSEVWYWISALKATEVGTVRKNTKTGDKFLTIALNHFERVEKAQDLSKLYTHRLPSLNKIGRKWMR